MKSYKTKYYLLAAFIKICTIAAENKYTTYLNKFKTRRNGMGKNYYDTK